MDTIKETEDILQNCIRNEAKKLAKKPNEMQLVIRIVPNNGSIELKYLLLSDFAYLRDIDFSEVVTSILKRAFRGLIESTILKGIKRVAMKNMLDYYQISLMICSADADANKLGYCLVDKSNKIIKTPEGKMLPVTIKEIIGE